MLPQTQLSPDDHPFPTVETPVTSTTERAIGRVATDDHIFEPDRYYIPRTVVPPPAYRWRHRTDLHPKLPLFGIAAGEPLVEFLRARACKIHTGREVWVMAMELWRIVACLTSAGQGAVPHRPRGDTTISRGRVGRTCSRPTSCRPNDASRRLAASLRISSQTISQGRPHGHTSEILHAKKER